MKKGCCKLICLRHTPPSLTEQCLRSLYLISYHSQVSKTSDNNYRRAPRVHTTFGKWLLTTKSKNTEIPRNVSITLRKGPQAFCCYCTKPIFTQAYIEVNDIKLKALGEDDFPLSPKTIKHFCIESCKHKMMQQ